jgi:hypothetical protein
MQQFKILLSIVFIILLISCNKDKESLKEKMTAKWMMVKVHENEKDVTAQYKKEEFYWIWLKPDNSFTTSDGKDSGRWEVNEKTNELFLKSSYREDSSWRLKFVDEYQIIWDKKNSPVKFRVLYTEIPLK